MQKYNIIKAQKHWSTNKNDINKNTSISTLPDLTP